MSNLQLNIKTINSRMTIKNHFRKFTLKRQAPTMQVRNRKPTFEVNWEQVRAESGLKSSRLFARDNQQQAYNKVMNYIGQQVGGGDYVMNNAGKGSDRNLLADVSRQNMLAALPEFNMTTMPQNLAQVDWDMGEFTVEWMPGKLEVMWDESVNPEINFTNHFVEITVRNNKRARARDNNPRENDKGKKVDKKI